MKPSLRRLSVSTSLYPSLPRSLPTARPLSDRTDGWAGRASPGRGPHTVGCSGRARRFPRPAPPGTLISLGALDARWPAHFLLAATAPFASPRLSSPILQLLSSTGMVAWHDLGMAPRGAFGPSTLPFWTPSLPAERRRCMSRNGRSLLHPHAPSLSRRAKLACEDPGTTMAEIGKASQHASCARAIERRLARDSDPSRLQGR